MYIIFGTDNPIDTVSPPAQLGHPRSTVLAVSDDDASTFHFLYYFSREPEAKFISAAIAMGLDRYIYSANWDGRGFASAVYFYRLQTGDFTQTRRMILIK
jgi:hypothetical protein